ncbi:hypothetical protein E3T39_06400 [Cryobacterium suzukii]|uniref:Uncharacterized protein n=1 Tax=Cryobacterium suzukii TaxID=1259198 RepID=A0A4R9AGN5_9MICO|nr:hypothetical protein [Cryobacterium suzukii]TFD61661.1 hypothetical protein E3T39_06400 [Cryobacterium suzukii]
MTTSLVSSASAGPAVMIRGQLWYAVPYVGYVTNVVNGANRDWIIPVLTVALFGYAGFIAARGALDP